MRAVVVVIAVVLLGAVCPAAAQGFYSSAPASLTAPHSSIDGAAHCDDCHVAGSKAIDDGKCLGCHDKLAARRARGDGFHASKIVRDSGECKSCHHEHQRRVGLIDWTSIGGQSALEAGNHVTHTKYPLRGSHAKTPCAKCHTTVSKFGDRLFMGVQNFSARQK